jgi:hypothetical protein
MSKNVTLTLTDEVYNMFRVYAQTHNRSLANFIETSALRYIQEYEYVDNLEMTEIQNNQNLQDSLQRALQDAKARRGRRIG